MASFSVQDNKIPDESFREMIVSCKSLSHYDSKSFKSLFPQIFATLLVCSYHIVVGISLAYSAILIPQLNQGDIEATKSESAWIASTLVVIIPVAVIIAGFLMDSLGRLNTIKLAAIPGVIGWILIATATNIPMLLVGRLLTGLAASWGTSPAIVYITEIARADLRGSLISVAPTCVSVGMVLAFLKGWFLNWRTVAWICNAYVIVPCILVCFIPESPVWLVSRGRCDEAARSLAWLYKYQPQPDDKAESYAELQLNLLKKDHELKLEAQKANGKGCRATLSLLLKPTGYKPILILCFLFLMQQFSGIYITLFYSVTFFQEMGSDVNPYFASVLIGAMRLLMSFVNTYLLRTFNRRPLIIISGLGMALCIGLSGLFTIWIKAGTSQHSWVPVTFVLLYVVASMIGLLPIPWTMTAEMFPIEIRGIAHSIAYSVGYLLMFLSVQSYWTLSDWFGGVAGVQFFFAVVSIVAVIYTFIFLPETHGRKLKDITDYFNYHTCFIGSAGKSDVSDEVCGTTDAFIKSFWKENDK